MVIEELGLLVLVLAQVERKMTFVEVRCSFDDFHDVVEGRYMIAIVEV